MGLPSETYGQWPQSIGSNGERRRTAGRSGGVPHLLLEGAKLADTRFDDGHRVASDVGSFRPNDWGLLDIHGNATEWTLDAYGDSDRKTVRGGSFFDRPARCRSSFRLAYPAWQRVFNVGFRVVVVDEIP